MSGASRIYANSVKRHGDKSIGEQWYEEYQASKTAEDLAEEERKRQEQLERERKREEDYQKFLAARQQAQSVEQSRPEPAEPVRNSMEEEVNYAKQKVGELSKDEQSWLDKLIQYTRDADALTMNVALAGGDPLSQAIAQEPLKQEKQEAEIAKTNLQKTGKDFSKHAQYINEIKDAKERENQQKDIEKSVNTGNKAQDVVNSAILTGYDIAMSPVAGGAAILSNIEAMNRPDQNAPVNTNSALYGMSNMSRDIEEGINKRIGDDNKIGQFAYGTGVSMGKAGLAMALGAGVAGELGVTGKAANAVADLVTLPTFGASSYATALQDAQERGLSKGQAQATAIVAGAAEMIFEKISVDKVWDIAKNQGKAFTRNAIANVLAQSGTEGTEEVFTDIANAIADHFINGDKSEYAQNVKKYGKDEANSMLIQQLAMDFAGGAVSGAVFGGIGSTANSIQVHNEANALYSAMDDKGNQTFTGKDVARKYRNLADSLPTVGNTTGQAEVGEYLKRSAEAMEMMANNDLEISQKDRNKIYKMQAYIEDQMENDSKYRQIVEEYRAQKAEENKATAADNFQNEVATINRELDQPNVTAAAGNTTEQKEVNATMDQITVDLETPEEFKAQPTTVSEPETLERLAKAQNAEELSTAYTDALNSTNITPDQMRTIESSFRQNQGKLNISDKDIENVQTPESAYQAGVRNDREFMPRNDIERNAYVKGMTDRAETVRKENDPKTATAKDNNGNTFTVKKIENVNGEPTVTTNQGTTMPLSELSFTSQRTQRLFNNASQFEDPQAYVDGFNPGWNVDLYDTALNNVYDYARLHGEKGSLQSALKGVEYANRIDRALFEQIYNDGVEEYARENKPAKKAQGKRVEGKATDETGKLNKNQKKVLDEISKKFGVDITVKSDGSLNTKDGKTINGFFNADNNQIVLNADGRDMFKTLIHESMGELSEEYAPEEMDELQRAIIDWHLEKHPKDFNETVAKYQQAYINHEGSKSYREAANEYVNDLLVDLFSDEQGIKDFAEYISNEPKSLFAKFVELIDNLINGIKELMGINRIAHDTFQDDVEALQNLRKMALDTWQKAIENKGALEGQTELKQASSLDVRNSLDVNLPEDRKREISLFVADVMNNRGQSNNKYNHQNVGKFSNNVVDGVLRATDGNIDLSNKEFAFEGGKLYHEISEHSDPDIENSRGQKTYNESNIADIIEAVMNPDIIEDAAANTSKDQRDAILFAKENNGGLVVVVAVGGKRNPVVTPEQIVWFTPKRWNDIKKANDPIIGEIYKNNKMRNYDADRLKEIKKNRVTVVRYGSENPSALTSETVPRSPLDSSITPSAQNTTLETRNSIEVDTEGNELSEGQETFFEKSKVRDEEGRLQVMYHGSPYGGFTIFRNGLNYFTANRDYAGRYTNPSASETGKSEATNPSVYEVYLNIEKPFDLSDPECQRIFRDEYVNQWSASSYDNARIDDEIANGLDWTEADNLYDFIQENDLDYDGIVLNEGGDLTESGTEYRGKSYVTFNANQVKNVDNENPTSDPDIRFSLEVPVEQSEDLIAVHNLSEGQLLESIKLGGFPMPSIAITKADMGHDKYGDISVLFYKDTIDPAKSKKNKVYGGDAWTPTFPRIEVKINPKVAENIRKRINNLVSIDEQRNIGFAHLDNENLEDQINGSRGLVSNAYKYNRTLQYAFLKDNGINIDVPQVDARLNKHFTNEQILAATNVVKDLKQAEALRLDTRSYSNNPEVVEALRKAINDQFRNKYADTNTKLGKKDLYEELSFADYDNLTAGLYKYYKDGIQKEMDSLAAQEAIKEQIEGREAEFEKWLNDLFDGIVEKKGLRNNKDFFTYSGNRRSWDVLHDEYSLENIVKIMSQQDDKGEAGFFSQSQIQALATKDFKNISEVRKNKNMLRMETEEERDARVTEQAQRFSDICNEIMDKTESNQFTAFGRASDAIAEAVRRYKTVQGIDRELRQWRGLNIQEDTAQKIYDLMKDIAENPTGYFEAKPKRAVGLDEIARAVVPDNSEQELFTAMDEASIPYETYKAGDQEDRKKVVNSVPDVRFSIEVIDDLKNRSTRYELDDALFEALDEMSYEAVTDDTMSQILNSINGLFRGQTVDRTAIENVAKDIKEYANSSVNTDYLTDELENLFNYMQNSNVDAREAFNMFKTVARDVAEQGETEDVDFNGFRKYIKGMRISLSDAQKAEVAKVYDSYDNFRKENFGTLTLANDGQSLDSLWREIVAESGNTLYLDEKEGSQPLALVDYLDSLKGQPVNNYGGNMDEVATDLAIRILEKYYAAEQEAMVENAKSEALSNQGEAKRQIELAREKMRKAEQDFKKQVREEYKEREAKIVAELEEAQGRALYYNQALKDLRRKADEGQISSAADKEALKKDQKEIQNLQNKLKNREMKLARALAKSKAPLQEYLERQGKVEEKRKIEQISNRLMKMVYNPTKTLYMPENLREPVGEFLAGIDFISHRGQPDSMQKVRWQTRMDALRNFLADKDGKNGIENLKEVMEEDLVDDMASFTMRNSEVNKISQMNSEELHNLYMILTRLSSSVSKANQTFANNVYKNIDNLNQDSMREMREMKDPKFDNAVMGNIKDFFGKDLEDPITYFSLLGEAPKSVFDELLGGFDKKVSLIKEAVDFMGENMPKGAYKWANDKHTFNTSEGEIELTTGQIMSLYETNKRKKAGVHLYEGGIESRTTELGRTKTSPAVHLSESDYETIFGTLTEEQKEIADKMQHFMADDCGEKGNEVSMTLWGYKKFTEKDYFPMKVDDKSRNTTNKDTDVPNLYRIKNISASKELTENADQPLIIEDIFDVFTNHVADMSDYYGMLLPLTDAYRWFNYREKQERGTGQNYVDGTKQQLDRLYGVAGRKYFENLMLGINGTEPKARGAKIPNWFISRYKKVAVMAKIRVAIQQPTSFIRAFDEMEAKYLLQALVSTNPVKYANKAKEKSMLAWWKGQGYYESYLGKGLKEMIVGKNPVYQKIEDFEGWGAQTADDLTWGVLYHAAELYIKDTTDFKEGTKSFDDAVVKKFEDVVSKTQVVDTTLHRTDIMRSQSDFAKLGTSFMTEPLKTYNMVLRSVVGAERDRDKKAINKLIRTLFIYILNNAVLTAVTTSWDAFRKDDDKTPYGERWLSMYGEEFIDNINPINMIPIVKDLIDNFSTALTGKYSFNDTDMSTEALSKLGRFLYHAEKAKEGDPKVTNYGLVKEGVQAVSYLLGIPAVNVMSDIEGIYNGFFENIETKIPSEYNGFYKAIDKGGDITAEVNKLKEAGKEEKTIKSQITRHYKDEYIATDDLTEKANMKNTLIKAFMAAGDTRDEAIKKIDKWE